MNDLGAIVGVVVFAPLLALLGAVVYALVLFWPVMIVLGALHSQVAIVPALGWWASFLLVALLHLLIPTGSSSSD